MDIATLVYFLCAFTSFVCAMLLFKGYRSSRSRFLLWSTLFFAGFFINNVVLVIDLVFFPKEIDLSMIRNVIMFCSVSILLYGMIFDIE